MSCQEGVVCPTCAIFTNSRVHVNKCGYLLRKQRILQKLQPKVRPTSVISGASVFSHQTLECDLVDQPAEEFVLPNFVNNPLAPWTRQQRNRQFRLAKLAIATPLPEDSAHGKLLLSNSNPLPSLKRGAAPKLITRLLEPVYRASVIGGAGDCWRLLFPHWDHGTSLTWAEFVIKCRRLYENTGTNYYLVITSQNDGDAHLARVYRRFSGRLGKFMDISTGEVYQWPEEPDYQHITDLSLEDYPDLLIGRPDSDLTPERVSRHAILDTYLYANAPDLLLRFLNWYADRIANATPTVPNLPPLERFPQIVLEKAAPLIDWLHFNWSVFLDWAVQHLPVAAQALLSSMIGFANLGSYAMQYLVTVFGDLFTLTLAAPKVLLGMKILAILTQDFSEVHGPEHVYRRVIKQGILTLKRTDAENANKAEAGAIFPTSLDERVSGLSEQVKGFPNTTPAEQAVVGFVRERANGIMTDISTLPRMVLPEDVPDATISEFRTAFPEYTWLRGVNSHPHAKLAAVRKVFRDRANKHLATRQRLVRAVGASNTEMPTIDRCVHNCWPTDSGRTAYRKGIAADALDNTLQITSDHRFQDCDADEHLVGGADIWSFFSAHDIDPADFIREMANKGSDTAVVALHLPFPLLDKRVNSFIDPVLGLRYHCEGDNLLVFHTDAHSAGYSHSRANLTKWMTNLPEFDGLHVQAEVIGQLSTAVLLVLTIGEGKQECVPSIWQSSNEDFYMLPELIGPDLLRQSPRQVFPVNARKFEQLTAYIASLDATQRTPAFVVPKIRGMMAEIRVGVHRVEPRWTVTLPQLYSLVHHGIIANKLYTTSTQFGAAKLKGYYARLANRNQGGFVQRYWQNISDLLNWRVHGEVDVFADRSWASWYFGNGVDHTHTYNPYVRSSQYLIANLDKRWGDDILKATFQMTKNWYQSSRTEPGDDRPAMTEEMPTEVPAPPAPEPVPPSDPAPPPPSAETMADDDDQEDRESDAARHVQAEAIFRANAEKLRAMQDPTESVVEGDAESDSDPDGLNRRNFNVAKNSDWSETLSDHSAAQPSQVSVETDYTFEAWLEGNVKANFITTLPDRLNSESKPRTINFEAPIFPVVGNHPANNRFKHFTKHDTFRWPNSECVIPMPDNGGVAIIQAAFNDYARGNFPKLRLPALDSAPLNTPKHKHIINALGDYRSDLPMDGPFNSKLTHYANYLRAKPGVEEIKVLTIDGPAMSAKSTLARSFVKTKQHRALVYVPSHALKEEWLKDNEFAARSEVLTRNSIPRSKAKPVVGIVDEVFNFNVFEIYYMLRTFARLGVKLALLVGDRYQREPTAVDLNRPFFNMKLQLHTSLGMPLDAHGLYSRCNNLSPDMYTTTGTLARSVYFTETYPQHLRADLEFKNHKNVAPDTVTHTVGRVQGSRAEVALYHADQATAKANWVLAPNRFSVTFTRHTKALVVFANAATTNALTLGTAVQLTSRDLGVVGARAGQEHRLNPLVLDDLLQVPTKTKVNNLISELRTTLSNPICADGHFVTHLHKATIDNQTDSEMANAGKTPQNALMEGIFELTNAEPEDVYSRDFVTEQPRRALKISEPGAPVSRTDVRNEVPNSNLLAAIHVNSSAFDSAKNLIDRQLATTKTTKVSSRDLSEGRAIYQRFRECFYRADAVLFSHDYTVDWLNDATAATVNNIARNHAPFETARDLLVDAEFKTQTKAKAQPGFAATLPYGQSILANSKNFNALFASAQPLAYLNVQRLMRDGVILDYGMSDQDLSNKLLTLGVADQMNGKFNFQADVSKQDSSHSAAFLHAFRLVLLDCGFDLELANFYFEYCRNYSFASRGADRTKSSVSFNLGSGDPFTLLRNDIMEMCVIAGRYHHANTMVIVEKGDDVHGILKDLTPGPLCDLPSIRSVRLTTDYGAPGYHAGRFHNGVRYLVDPVRAFFKHFTRLSDENVPDSELYLSYVSRSTDYTEPELDFLVAASQVHYPYLEASFVEYICRLMLKLRERNVFMSFSKLRFKDVAITVDTKGDCAANCVRALRPGKPKSFYRQFSHLPQSQLVAKLQYHGIPCVKVSDDDYTEKFLDVIIVGPTHARLHMTFNSKVAHHDN